jgi:ribosomal protein S18 acetylase RimI-like enzyme
MTAPLIIRPATAADRPNLRAAIVELQEFERILHATRRPGEEIADAYLAWVLRKVEAEGAVLVAETGGDFVGFVAGWIENAANIAETPDSNRVGYISDICVMPAFRGRRIATQLLGGIERHLRQSGVTRVRINSLAANTSAQASYRHAGFVPYETLYEKLIESDRDGDLHPR